MQISELTDPSDPLLCFWLELLQKQFPLDEQVLAASIVRMVQQKEKGEAGNTHLWAALTEDNEPVGMTWFDLDGKETALWYIAVKPGQEGHGYGSKLMQAITSRVFAEADCDLIVMEVENAVSHGSHASSDEAARHNEQIEKRNTFYIDRHGAWQLTGIKYMQQAGGSAPIPMDLLVLFNPARPILSAEETFARCANIFGESLLRAGEIGLSKAIQIP